MSIHVTAPTASERPRRNFLIAALAAVCGGVVALVPVAAGVAFLLDPILRKKKPPTERALAQAEGGFVKVATLAALPEDGRPVAFKVYQFRQNGWNYFANQEVGAVYLRKLGEQVIAFNTRCPHLGCTIDFRPAKGDFYCPCHTSTFDLDGKKLNPIPPRNMDDLEVKVAENGDVLVKFQKFRAGTPEKVPVA